MSSVWLILITLCSLSRFTSIDAQITPNDTGRTCTAGHYNNGNFCVFCPSRTISKDNAFRCVPCPAGQYTYDLYGTGDGTFCGVCKPGMYVREGTDCVECPAGTYSEVNNAPKCEACPTNTTTPNTEFGVDSKSKCHGCGKGFFLFPGVGGDCKYCYVGSYQDEKLQGTCKPCPPGTGGDESIDSGAAISPEQCHVCAPGFYSHLDGTPTAGERSCRPCPWGHYAPTARSATCKRCPSGSISTSDRTRCIPKCKGKCRKRNGCPPGTQPFKGDSTDCRRCPVTRVNTMHSTTECTECQPLSHPPFTLELKPNAARDGCECKNTKMVTDTTDNSCSSCPSGSFKLNTTACGCPAGQTYTSSGCVCPIHFKRVGRHCIPCTAREIANSRDENKDDICNLCWGGSFFNKSKGKCQICPPGQTNSGRHDNQSCVACTHRFVNKRGKLRCGCKPGTDETYNNAGRMVCRPCRKGTAWNSSYGNCESCDYASYSDERGLVKCKNCPKGQRYSRQYEQRKCPPSCPLNAYPDYDQCKCKRGFRRKNVGKSFVCVRCPANQVSTYSRWRCVCPDGWRWSKTKCVPCERGTAGYNGSCKKCEINYIAPRKRMSACKICGPGYSLRKGGTKCYSCPSDMFVTPTGKCRKCKAGFRVRNFKCVRCFAKHVSAGGSVSFCTPCGRGKKPSGDRSRCIAA